MARSTPKQHPCSLKIPAYIGGCWGCPGFIEQIGDKHCKQTEECATIKCDGTLILTHRVNPPVKEEAH